MKPAVVDQHKSSMPHAQVHLNVGHTAFWDDASAFNERLHAFYESLPSHGAKDHAAPARVVDAV